MTGYNVGDLVAEFIHQVGIDTVFGVVSVHNIPMVDALGRRNTVRIVPARGEMGAGHMADGYARARRGLGCFLTSTGPGAANAPGALVEARFGSSPVLHLTGQTATADLDQAHGAVHDVPDQLGMLRSVSKRAYRIATPESALGILMKAAADALTPPMGPVSIEIPIDVQRAQIKRPDQLDSISLPIPAPEAGDTASLDAIAAMAAKAKHPLLWCGTGAKFARAEVERLAGLGFAIVTSVNGRAVVPEDHPMSLGAFVAAPAVEKLYETVDLMIVAGGRVRGHETRDLQLKLPARRVQIDIDPEANGRTYTCDHFHVGEVGAALAALADRLDGRMQVATDWADTIAATRKTVHAAFRETLGPYGDFPAIVRDAMPADALWVRDITISNSTWGNRTMPLNAPEQNIYPVGAAIGPGYQMAIGAALATPRRKTVALTGDGGFFLNVTELWTAVQENADVVIMVMNDRGYGVIKDIQDTLYGGRHFAADPVFPDLEGLAKLAHLPFWRVSATDELGPKLKEAIAVDGPAMVEVDMTKFGKYPRYFTPPPYAKS
ncbi:MAG: thiamine pyrophosphate-binding protein [Hyphomicrobiaceae bacterium]|nr:thiamine pyrophosphate-binding protein [Hyphomicrobiaceae bacterium]